MKTTSGTGTDAVGPAAAGGMGKITVSPDLTPNDQRGLQPGARVYNPPQAIPYPNKDEVVVPGDMVQIDAGDGSWRPLLVMEPGPWPIGWLYFRENDQSPLAQKKLFFRATTDRHTAWFEAGPGINWRFSR